MTETIGNLSFSALASNPATPSSDPATLSRNGCTIGYQARASPGNGQDVITPEEAAGLSVNDLILTLVVLYLSLGVPLACILLAFAHGSAVWQILSVILAAGAFSGCINALLSENRDCFPGQ